jgi:hypothetical protein
MDILGMYNLGIKHHCIVSDMADAKIGGADTADASMKMFFKNQ